MLLLETQSDLLLLAIDLQNLDFDFLVDGDHLGWMADTFPAHIGDVQQTIDTAQVDERTEVGDILDDTFAELADFQFGEQVSRSSSRCFSISERRAADNDIAAGLVDLEDFACTTRR